MSGEPTQKKPDAVSVGSAALLGWLGVKLAETEKTLKTREQMAATYRTGTNAEWDAEARLHPSTVGMKSYKADRIKEAEMQDRIAALIGHDRDMYRAAIAALSPPNAASEPRRQRERTHKT